MTRQVWLIAVGVSLALIVAACATRKEDVALIDVVYEEEPVYPADMPPSPPPLPEKVCAQRTAPPRAPAPHLLPNTEEYEGVEETGFVAA